MEDLTYYDQEFRGEATKSLFTRGQRFEECHFIAADLSQVKLSQIRFSDCTFTDCNLDRCLLVDTSFQNVEFKNCRLLGVNFDACSPLLLAMTFIKCHLSICSFHKLDLKGTRFTGSELHEIDFSESDLQGADFSNCDLARSIFQATDLRKADLRSAISLTLDPQQNQVKGTRFSPQNVGALLARYGIVIEESDSE